VLCTTIISLSMLDWAFSSGFKLGRGLGFHSLFNVALHALCCIELVKEGSDQISVRASAHSEGQKCNFLTSRF
jgi:hypothetical protein